MSDSQDKFTSGMLVQFRGLIVGEVKLPPLRGRLMPYSGKVTTVGAVTIANDPNRLIFNSNGSLYSHASHGILLEKVKEPTDGEKT